MSTRVALEHRTTYVFDREVTLAPHVVRLRPAPHTRTPVEAYSLDVEPADHLLGWQQDPFGNWVARLVFPTPADRLSITVGLVADLPVLNPFDFFVEAEAERHPFAYAPGLAGDLAPYLAPVAEPDAAAPGPLLAALHASLPAPSEGTGTVALLGALNAAVHDAVSYTVRMEEGVQSPEETLRTRTGSCRDSAWLLVALLREHGLAARFVSGYLVQLAPDPDTMLGVDGPAGAVADFTDLHAWAEVFLPGAGWVGLDPTSSLFAGEGHIPLAATPHPFSAAAITGTTSPAGVALEFSNTVRRLAEDRRPARPYSEAEWARVEAVAEVVDVRLDAGDVRLRTAASPTYLPRGGGGAAQATACADVLVDRLAGWWHDEHGAGHVVERAPGGRTALHRRRDGVPLWQDPSLLASLSTATPDIAADARAVAFFLTRTLGLPEEHLLPAHDPTGDAASEPVAWVLPLVAGPSWTAPRWDLAGAPLRLAPGPGPAAARLPAPAWSPQPSPEAADGTRTPGVPVVEPGHVPGPPTTALVLEVRDGLLHVSLPPTVTVEDHADLLRLVEVAVRRVGGSVALGGHGLPPDPRLETLAVAAPARVDAGPGTVRVDLPATATWAEQRDLAVAVDHHARHAGLVCEDFALDGRALGTGAGHRLTVEGPTPEQSPLLRRPALLAGLVAHWQRHPSLSVLLGERLRGAAGTAPRVDETGPALDEVELALGEVARSLPSTGPHEAAAVGSRLQDALAGVLHDAAGDPAGAELAVDALAAAGRLRLRGLAMPPHPRTALVQVLLVRALVARCWDAPVPPLVRWGAALHDDLLLPTGLARDLAAVVEDLRAHGLAVEHSWFAPFWEQAFPVLGRTRLAATAGDGASGVELVLRVAAETWPLVSRPGPGGLARYLDSSTDRLEVTVRGLDPERHLVLAAGAALPLHPADGTDAWYAGVRFRAWSPPVSAHPTLPVHLPLRVEVLDLATGVSLGGLTHRATHPDGRGWDTAPVNAEAAQARRGSLLDAHGRTPGVVDPAAARERGRRGASPEHPRTLDLRRVPADPDHHPGSRG